MAYKLSMILLLRYRWFAGGFMAVVLGTYRHPIYGLLVYCKPSFQFFNAINRDRAANYSISLLRFRYLRTPDESIRLLSPFPTYRFLKNLGIERVWKAPV
jgi:hypothetical protein